MARLLYVFLKGFTAGRRLVVALGRIYRYGLRSLHSCRAVASGRVATQGTSLLQVFPEGRPQVDLVNVITLQGFREQSNLSFYRRLGMEEKDRLLPDPAQAPKVAGSSFFRDS